MRTPPASTGVGGLRALVEEGIVTAAALNARDDLELAAASTHRLGALTSGMWRALSRELATAAERLGRSTADRLEDIERRSRVLEVDADEVVAAGVAAMHLAEHRETLDTLIPPDADAHRLLGADMLFGFSIDAGGSDDDSGPETDTIDDDASLAGDDESALLEVRLILLLWPAPLTPATLTIRSSGSEDVVESDVPPLLLEALSAASGYSTDRVSQALSALAVACWSAHHLDELSDDELDEEETDDDAEEDGGPLGV